MVAKRSAGSSASARRIAARIGRGTDVSAGSGRMRAGLDRGRELARGWRRRTALAVERAVERAAQRPLIGAGVDVAAGVLLGRHVGGRAHHRAGPGQGRARACLPAAPSVSRAGDRALGRIADVRSSRRRAHQAEVGDAHDAVAIDERVGRLEVAVHQAGAVGGGQSARRLDVGRDDLAPAARPGLAPGGQVLAVDQLHHDAGAIAEPDHLVDGDHVRMRQLGHRLRLAHQSPARLAVVAGDQLDRDQAAQLRVVRRHHQAHAAEGDDVADRVAADLGADDALEPRLDGERGGRLEHRVRSPPRPSAIARPGSRPPASPLAARPCPGPPCRARTYLITLPVACQAWSRRLPRRSVGQERRARQCGRQTGPGPSETVAQCWPAGQPLPAGQRISHELIFGPRGPAMP